MLLFFLIISLCCLALFPKISFDFFFSVTRSQQRLLNLYGIRECHVRIETNFPTVAMAWLNRGQQQQQQPRPIIQNIPAIPAIPAMASAGPSADQTARAPAAAVRRSRRASVASGRNLFDVDGNVVEVGFDHLSRLHRVPVSNNSISENIGERRTNRTNDNRQRSQTSQNFENNDDADDTDDAHMQEPQEPTVSAVSTDNEEEEEQEAEEKWESSYFLESDDDDDDDHVDGAMSDVQPSESVDFTDFTGDVELDDENGESSVLKFSGESDQSDISHKTNCSGNFGNSTFRNVCHLMLYMLFKWCISQRFRMTLILARSMLQVKFLKKMMKMVTIQHRSSAYSA